MGSTFAFLDSSQVSAKYLEMLKLSCSFEDSIAKFLQFSCHYAHGLLISFNLWPTISSEGRVLIIDGKRLKLEGAGEREKDPTGNHLPKVLAKLSFILSLFINFNLSQGMWVSDLQPGGGGRKCPLTSTYGFIRPWVCKVFLSLPPPPPLAAPPW